MKFLASVLLVLLCYGVAAGQQDDGQSPCMPGMQMPGCPAPISEATKQNQRSNLMTMRPGGFPPGNRQPHYLGHKRRADIHSGSNAHDHETWLDVDVSRECICCR